jgi:hypothetical protein
MNLQHERIATLCTKLKLERVAAEWTPPALAFDCTERGR